ncbi:MAG: sulfurtransferase [Trueperaceae bacterium]
MSNLIAAPALRERLGDAGLRIVDVRFDLTDPEAGRGAYLRGHVPGAVHLDLEKDLSGPVAADRTGGRHPLPDPDGFARRLAHLGIGEEHDVVAYDDAGGAMAARAWWLLRWIGHRRVRVLDGGVAAWVAAGGALSDDEVAWPAAEHRAHVDPPQTIDADELLRRRDDPSLRLLDARAPERYRGETEPLDPVAGHVPGAWNRPFAENLRGGRIRPVAEVRERLAGATGHGEVAVYCGSGVTAAHLALALEEVGLGMPRLYAGSWSDWTSCGDRPVATGDAETGSEATTEAHRAHGSTG